MGCDINALIQIRDLATDGCADYQQAESREWLIFDWPWLERNYECFAAIAGVRAGMSAVEPLYQPRGLPWDAYEKPQGSLSNWSSELHSHSYLTLSELKAAFEHAGILMTNLPIRWRAIIAAMEVLAKELEVRIVFAFDN